MIDAARLVRGLLPASGAEIADDAHWRSVRERAEEVAQSLDHSSAAAPGADAANAARRAADALRGLVFALESDALLRDGALPPSAQQIADVNTAISSRSLELDAALDELGRLITPQHAANVGPGD